MENISMSTLLSMLRVKEDVDIRIYAFESLSKILGTDAAEMLRTIAKGSFNHTDVENLTALVSKLLPAEYREEVLTLLPYMLESYDYCPVSIEGIMELYHSKDQIHANMAKSLLTYKYGRYVHDMIHKQFFQYAEKYGEELYQCGVIGLLKAAVNYQLEKGAFTTYCSTFVRHEIASQINYHHASTTVHYSQLQKKIKAAVNQLNLEGMEPTVSKIAILTDLRPETVKRELDYMERTNFSSLDEVEEKKERANEYELGPEALYEKKESSQILYSCIKNYLKEPIRTVVLLRCEGITNEQIAERTHLTLGKVKTCFNKGIATLKHNEYFRANFQVKRSKAEEEMSRYATSLVPNKEDVGKQLEDLADMLGGCAFGSSDDLDDFFLASVKF